VRVYPQLSNQLLENQESHAGPRVCKENVANYSNHESTFRFDGKTCLGSIKGETISGHSCIFIVQSTQNPHYEVAMYMIVRLRLVEETETHVVVGLLLLLLLRLLLRSLGSSSRCRLGRGSGSVGVWVRKDILDLVGTLE